MRKTMMVLIAGFCLISLLSLAACSVLDLIPSMGDSSAGSGANSGATPEVSTSLPGVSGSLPTESPSAAPGAADTPAPGQGINVTLADQGQTIQLKVGQRFLLDLGEGYDWTPVVADQTIVRRVPNIAVIRGAQGVYEALAAGQTTLSVTGDPQCRQSTPPCAMPSRMFSVTLVVAP